ncbi:hypothetical protein BG005_008531 [Podila minutissima]|nr:hypothetical protein BG005_008531 [Podila minutissima]
MGEDGAMFFKSIARLSAVVLVFAVVVSAGPVDPCTNCFKYPDESPEHIKCVNQWCTAPGPN